MKFEIKGELYEDDNTFGKIIKQIVDELVLDTEQRHNFPLYNNTAQSPDLRVFDVTIYRNMTAYSEVLNDAKKPIEKELSEIEEKMQDLEESINKGMEEAERAISVYKEKAKKDIQELSVYDNHKIIDEILQEVFEKIPKKEDEYTYRFSGRGYPSGIYAVSGFRKSSKIKTLKKAVDNIYNKKDEILKKNTFPQISEYYRYKDYKKSIDEKQLLIKPVEDFVDTIYDLATAVDLLGYKYIPLKDLVFLGSRDYVILDGFFDEDEFSDSLKWLKDSIIQGLEKTIKKGNNEKILNFIEGAGLIGKYTTGLDTTSIVESYKQNLKYKTAKSVLEDTVRTFLKYSDIKLDVEAKLLTEVPIKTPKKQEISPKTKEDQKISDVIKNGIDDDYTLKASDYLEKMSIPKFKRDDKATFNDLIGMTEDKADELMEPFISLLYGAPNEIISSKSVILLEGPAGTGKSYSTQALANELGVNFKKISSADLLKKYLGESQQSFKDKILEAINVYKQTNKQSFIFIDEAETLFPRKDSESHEVRKDIVSMFNSYTSGPDKKDIEGKVVFVLTVNNPEIMDPTVLSRAKSIKFELPDKDIRHDLLIQHTVGRYMRTDFEKIDWNKLAEETEGFSIRDIAEEVNPKAKTLAIRDKTQGKRLSNISERKRAKISNTYMVTQEHLEKAIEATAKNKRNEYTINKEPEGPMFM